MQTEDLKNLHKLRSEIRGLELLIRDMSGAAGRGCSDRIIAGFSVHQT